MSNNITVDLSKLSRKTLEAMAQEGVGGTIASTSGTFGGRVRGAGRVPAAKGNVLPAPVEATPTATPKTRTSPAARAALTTKLRNYIKKNPGLGMENIAKALSVKSSKLQPLVGQLATSGLIRFEGEKRARRYFPNETTPAVNVKPTKAATKTVVRSKRAPAKTANGAAAHAN